MLTFYRVGHEAFVEAVQKARSFADFARIIGGITGDDGDITSIRDTLESVPAARKDFNQARSLLGLRKLRYRRSKQAQEG